MPKAGNKKGSTKPTSTPGKKSATAQSPGSWKANMPRGGVKVSAKGPEMTQSPKQQGKHVAPPASLREISETLGVTDEEIARVRRILLKHGYIKEAKASS